MISALLLATMAQTTEPPSADNGDNADIVVIARQLAAWRGEGRFRGENWECRTLVSTADLEIDAIGCRAMEICFRAARPQFQAVASAELRRAERRRRNDAIFAERVSPCVRQERDDGIADLAARRSEP